jgi:hypothetical protein
VRTISLDSGAPYVRSDIQSVWIEGNELLTSETTSLSKRPVIRPLRAFNEENMRTDL